MGNIYYHKDYVKKLQDQDQKELDKINNQIYACESLISELKKETRKIKDRMRKRKYQ